MIVLQMAPANFYEWKLFLESFCFEPAILGARAVLLRRRKQNKGFKEKVQSEINSMRVSSIFTDLHGMFDDVDLPQENPMQLNCRISFYVSAALHFCMGRTILIRRVSNLFEIIFNSKFKFVLHFACYSFVYLSPWICLFVQ